MKNSRLPSPPRIGEGTTPPDVPSLRGEERGNLVAHPVMDRRVADDALLDVTTPGLELRLDQSNKARAGPEKLSDAGQHELQRDEAHVDGRKVRQLGQA